MRIEKTGKSGAATQSGRAGRGASSGPEFRVDLGDAPQKTAATAQAAPASGIEGLLAVQAVDEREHSRRRAYKRGTYLLDFLDQIKLDLLGGQVSSERLNQAIAVLQQARGVSEPELESLVDDIELRVRVELAKMGRFPSL